MRYRSPTIARILAGQSHYPDHLLRAEGRRSSGARLVGEHLFYNLREEEEEDIIIITTTTTTTFVVACFFLLLRFLFGGY